MLGVSLLAGGQLSTSKLGASFDGMVKLEHPMSGWFEVFAELGYAQPTTSLSAASTQLGASGATSYQATLSMQEVMVTAGAAYLLRTRISALSAYAGVGARAHFIKSTANGSDGNAFGSNVEASTVFGAVALGGAAYRLGPGRALGELQVGWAPAQQQFTGPSNLGAVSLLLGYGLLF
jgi:hypothetical protein